MCFEKPLNMLLFETHVASRRIKSKSQHKKPPRPLPPHGGAAAGAATISNPKPAYASLGVDTLKPAYRLCA